MSVETALRNYRIAAWVTGIGLRSEDHGTHSLRRTKASLIYNFF